MHIFEVLHHFIKECSVSKWFLTVEGRAVEKKSMLFSIVFLFIKELYGRVVPPKVEQGIYSQEIMFSKNKGCKYRP